MSDDEATTEWYVSGHYPFPVEADTEVEAVDQASDKSGWEWEAVKVAGPSTPTIQILHERDPDAECGVTVFIDGVRFTGDVEVEDVDPGRGYDEVSIKERRDEAEARATRPDATDFDKAVAQAVGVARFERFGL